MLHDLIELLYEDFKKILSRGNGEWGMGLRLALSRAGMGNGEWGVGSGKWGVGSGEYSLRAVDCRFMKYTRETGFLSIAEFR